MSYVVNFIFLGLFLCACSVQKGEMDIFFEDKNGWIPMNQNLATSDKDIFKERK